MREIRTSGLTRGSNGTGASRPLLSTLSFIHVHLWLKFFDTHRPRFLSFEIASLEGQPAEDEQCDI